MNRLLVWSHERDDRGVVHLTDRRAVHLREVLRAVPGDVLRAGIVDGPAALAHVRTVSENRFELWVEEQPDVPLPPPPALDLLLAMPRPKFLKRLLPQLTVLGVRRLYLGAAQRTERFYFDTHLLRSEHYLPLLIEGLEQSTDTRLPELHVLRPLRRPLREWLAPAYAPDHRVLAHPGPRSPCASIPHERNPLLVAIGPEGGWTPDEIEQFEALEFRRFALGSRILRTDMACVAVLSLIEFLRTPTQESPCHCAHLAS